MKLGKTHFLFILLAFSAGEALGAKIDIKVPRSRCEDVDVRDDMSQEMKEHFTEPRSQDSIGWCFAFAAADLVSAEVGESVSSTHASTIYNEGVEDSFFMKVGYKLSRMFTNNGFKEVYEGGFIKRAVNDMSRRKVCKEEDLPFDEQMSGSTKYRFINLLERAKESMDKGDDKATCDLISDVIAYNNLTNSVEDIYLSLEKYNLNSSLEKIANEHCKGRMVDVPNLKVKKIHPPKYRRDIRGDRDRAMRRLTRRMNKYFEDIDSALSRGKPLGIEYDVKSVTRQKGGHASVVTARRWRNGRCEFKIRNSWGKGCSMYDPREIADCDYDEGSFWVSDQKFYDMAKNLSFID